MTLGDKISSSNFSELDNLNNMFSKPIQWDNVKNWDLLFKKNNITEYRDELKGFCTDNNYAAKTVENFTTYLNKQNTATSKLGTVLKSAGSIVKSIGADLLSMGIMMAAGMVVQGIIDIATAGEKAADAAQKAGTKYTDAATSIDDYREKIQSLYEIINNSSSTTAEVTQARTDLMNIQSKMIGKYGSEAAQIDLVTDSLKDQATALEQVSELKTQSWDEIKREFNQSSFTEGISNFINGYSDRFDRMKTEYGNYGHNQGGGVRLEEVGMGKIEDEKVKKQLKYLLSSIGELKEYENGAVAIQLEGNATETYDKLLKIKDIISDIDYDFPGLDEALDKEITNAKNISDKYKEYWDGYILNEKILNDSKSDYADYYKTLTDEHDKYQNAVVDGDETAITLAKETLFNSMKDVLNNTKDSDVNDYFKSMFSDIQKDYNEWDFTNAFNDNVENLKGDVESALSDLGNLSKEQLDNFDINVASESQVSAYAKLSEYAEKYGLDVSALIPLLVELGEVSSESYTALVNKFGKNNIDTLSPEDLDIAYSVNNDTIKSWEELQNAIAAAKAEANDAADFSNFQDTLKSVSGLKTALSAQSSNGYLSKQDVTTLLDADPNMEEAIKHGIAGMYIDTDKAQELINQQYALRDAEAAAAEAAEKIKLKDTTSQMVELAGSTERYQKLLQGIENGNIDEVNDSFSDVDGEIKLSASDLLEFQNLQSSADSSRGIIAGWQQIQSEIRGATSLLKQYNDAQSTPKERSSYQSVVDAKKTADELYKNGWYQDDQLVAFAKLIAKNGATEEEALKDFKENEKKNSKYLTEDSAKGVNQFVKDAIAKGAIRKEKDKKGNEKLIIDSMEELANAFGISTELADYLIRGSNDSKYNFDIEPINEYTQALKEVDYDSDGAVTAVENVIKQMQAASDSGEDVSDTIDSVNKAIEELENQDLDTTELRNELDKLTTKGGGVDLQNRQQISGEDMQKAGWNEVGKDETATVYSSSYSSEDGKKTVVVTPILPDGSVLSPEALDNYAEDLLSGKSENKDIELRTYIGDDSIDRAERYAEALHLVQEQFYMGDEAGKASLNTLQDYTAEQLKAIDLTDKGVENGEKQLTDLLSSLGLGKESASELIDVLYDMGLLKVKPEVDTSEADQAVEDTKENAENSNPTVHYKADTSETDEATKNAELDINKMVHYVNDTSELNNETSALESGKSTTFNSRVNGENKLVTATKDQEGTIHYTADVNGVVQEITPLENQNGTVTFKADNSEVEKAKTENEKPTSSTHTEILKTENQTTNTTNVQDNTGSAVSKIVNNINGQKGTITVDASTGIAQGKVRKLLQYIAGVHPKIAIDILKDKLTSSVSNALDRTWSINVKANVSGMPKSGNSGNSNSSGANQAAGTLHPAHAGGTLVKESGTAYNVLNMRAHAHGTDVGLQNDETALINEVGTEALIRDGQLYEIPGGTHFQSLKRGDVIINAAQWSAIKKYGSTSSFAGKAYASGTLNATGIPAHFDEKATGNALDYLEGLSDGDGKDKNKDKIKKKKTDKKKTTKASDDYLDWIEIKISRIEDAISNLDRTATSAFAGWSSRLSDLNSEISKTVEEIDIQTKGAARYEKQAASVGLKDSIAKLVRNGTIDINKYDDKTKQKISDYQTWWDKAVACKNAIEELKEKEKELYKQKFEDVATKYEGYITAIENASNRIDELISQDEQKGLNASEKYYQAQQTYQKNTISNLKSQRDQQVKELADMLKNGQVVRGSEAWYEMTGAIDDTTKSIMEADTKILELQNDIRQLNWDRFDSLQDKISNVNSEAEFLVELMSEHDLFTDEGKITDRGTTTMGLYSQEYNTYMNQADRYASEIKKINAELAKDENKYNKDLIERRDSLVESQQSAIQSAQKMKQSIKSLVSDGFDKEISHLGDLIEKYEDALDSQKDLYDYQDTIKDKTSEIAKLERQIEVYSRDTSEEGRLNLQKAQSSLKDAKKDLESTQMDKSIEVQKQLLSDMQDDYQDFIDEKLKDIDKIVNDALDISNSKSADIWNTIASESKEVGYDISSQLKQIWENSEGKDVVKGYNEGFLSNLTTINTAIQSIDSYLNSKKSYEDQKANTNISTAKSNSGESLVDKYLNAGKAPSSTGTKQPSQNQSSKTSSKNNPYGKTSSISGNIRSSSKKKYIQSVQWTMKQLGYYSGSIDGKWNQSLRKALMSYQSKSGVVKSPDVVGSKTKGAFKKDGYKTGVYDLKQDETAWTQEGYKPEAIIRRSDGAILTPLTRGDSVLTSDATKNMYDFFNDPNKFFNMPSGVTNVTANNTFNNSMTVNMKLEGIKDYNDLVYKMKHDPNFEKMIQAMTVNQLTGGSKLDKYKY